MDGKRFCLIVLLIFPAVASHALGFPETSITRTHLMKDIDRSTVTIALGVEDIREEEEGEADYQGDFLFGYLGYSPLDWLEFGVAVHTAELTFFPAAELKIDAIDLFTDSSRFSLLLMGGIGGLREDGVFHLVYHGGGALNYQVREDLQLYLGAGGDCLSEALSLQGGLYAVLLEWLGLSVNLKVVGGPDGWEPMLSAAAIAVVGN
ncbi:MAG: hypothetical protein JXB06_11785 [Spirochaetales bacterium]|nr:hypothetical protein [Spirochaetales bacterium]